MSETLLGAAIQGGIGVVALVVLVIILKSFLIGLQADARALREDLRSLNDSLMKVSMKLGELIGRSDPTPVRTAKEDVIRRRAAAARRNQDGE
jgi:hypothetical protein